MMWRRTRNSVDTLADISRPNVGAWVTPVTSAPERLHPRAETVQRVLIEDRRDLLRFIVRRIPDSIDAEVILQWFTVCAMEISVDLREVASVQLWRARVLT
jgi:hypothetical protein